LPKEVQVPALLKPTMLRALYQDSFRSALEIGQVIFVSIPVHISSFEEPVVAFNAPKFSG